jgi:CheY-like chemotaxis protein/HPt (histidine-containing phosphotransfer) domain-containing protein
VLNLVGNAIKFSSGLEREGSVALRAEAAVATDGRPQLILRVVDNGIGMSVGVQQRLFTPFTQADASTTRRFGGTGLGLSISHRLVTMMAGRIEVQSVPGQGSVFTVWLPCEPAPTPAAPPGRPDVHGLRCLVLGDVGGMAADLVTYLAHGGAQADAVPDLPSAQAWLRDRPGGSAPVVVDSTGTLLDALRAGDGPGATPPARFVRIGRGRRRRARVDELGVVEIDGDAMQRSEFLKAVAMAAGRVPAQTWDPQVSALASVRPVPTIDEARAAGRLILVAEDNDVNRQVIAQQLALVGLAAEVACDGHQALQLWQRGGHAALLTDLHMPGIDGYELARQIRAQEHGPTRLPIIAISANAIRGEAQRCLDVGMDDYLAKPIQTAALQATLDRWLATPHPALPARSTPAAIGKGSQVVDEQVLKSYVGDDPALIRELLSDFRASAVHAARQMRSAVAVGDSQALAATAHRLKSSSRQVGAKALGELCAQLEAVGHEGRIEPTLLGKFDDAVAAVDEFLASR